MRVSSHAVARLALVVGAALCPTSSHAFVPASCQQQHQHQHQFHNICPQLQAAPNGSDNNDDERAGRGGYSVLRQPLSWDDESDPTLAPPKSLDEDDDAAGKRSNVDWFEGKKKLQKGKAGGGVNIASNKQSAEDYLGNQLSAPTKSASHHRTEESEQDLNLQSLDLHRRTLDTLDYPLVLGALSEECTTKPARSIFFVQAVVGERWADVYRGQWSHRHSCCRQVQEFGGHHARRIEEWSYGIRGAE